MTLVSIWFALRTHRVRLTPGNITHVEQTTPIDKDVFKLKWSPDGKEVAFVGWQQPVEIRRAVDLAQVRTENGRLIGFAFSSNRNTVACCTNSKTAEIRDLGAGTVITIDVKNAQPALAFSPNGAILATGGYGTAVRLWNVADGKLLKVLHAGVVTGGLTPVFSPDGKTLAVGNRNSVTCLFDVASGQQRKILAKRSTHEIQFDPTGRGLVASYVDGSVVLWDVATGKMLHTCDTGAAEIYTVDWSPDGKMVAAAGLHGDILILDGTNLKILRRLSGPEWVISVKFNPDGSRLLSAGGMELPGGKRWVDVWKTSPGAFEIVLTIAFWIVGALLATVVFFIPVVKWMFRRPQSSVHISQATPA